ncbi:MAG: hypothetical protein ACYC3I_23805 [Gemmataceae bacterium]
MSRSTIAVLKKAAAILTTIGFFAAAVFLAAILWMPAQAAPSNTVMEAESSLLFALDTPRRPTPKLHPRDLPTLTDNDMEMLADLPSPDLVTELNNWTYTQGNLGQDIFNFYAAVYQFINAFERQLIYNLATLLKNDILALQSFLGGPNSPFGALLSPSINGLSYVQNVYSCHC